MSKPSRESGGCAPGTIPPVFELPPDLTIERLRGRVDERWSERLLAFWTTHGALSETEGRERLPEVVCVVLDGAGEIAGVSSVFSAELPVVGGRRFWIFRSFAPGAAEEVRDALVAETFAALDAEFDPAGDGAIGLCLLLGPEEAARRPELEWPNPRTIYAGYLDDGRQVRVAYFYGASVTNDEARMVDPGWDLESGPRIEPFAEQTAVDAQMVIDVWVREGAVGADEARRRASEVLLVAVEADGELVGITTAYLRDHPQLRTPMWHFRAYVVTSHRRSLIGVRLAKRVQEHLSQRFAAGDTRAPGVLMEVENEAMKQFFPHADWSLSGYVFVGENERGDPVYVHYFPGAHAPGPGGAQGST
jgi:hypothetical protein